MKRIFTLLLCTAFLFTASLQAQLESGSIAPNFTTTDLDGNEIVLYDLLDEGYTVILDFSATWCGPCWNYHTGGALEGVWEEYGPEGTNEFYVIMIEGDPSTPLQDLYGPSSTSVGDWVTGTPYPIANDDNLAGPYQIGYWPTIYTVCPNRIITETSQIGTEAHHAFRDNCEFPSGVNNAGILGYEGDEGFFCGDLSLDASFIFQNLGTETMTSATFELVLNGTVAQTTDWTGELATYEFETISFDDVNITEETAGIVRVASVNGVDDEDASNDEELFSLGKLTVDQQIVNLEIRTDNYGGETYWYFADEEGNVIAEGGNTAVGPNGGGIGNPPPGGYASGTTYNEEIVLPADGCYTFTMVDSYGDGICCSYGNGYYNLTDADGTVLASGGEFEGYDDISFEAAGLVDVKELTSVSAFKMFPNPVSERMTVNFNLTEANFLQVEVYNTLGQLVQTLASDNFGAGQHTLEVNATNLSQGVYFVRMRNGERELNRRFVVNR